MQRIVVRVRGAGCRAMFVRVKKIGAYEYLYLVENAREGGRHVQRLVKALGHKDAPHPTTAARHQISQRWSCWKSVTGNAAAWRVVSLNWR